VLVLEDDHSSPVLEWVTRAPAEGFAVETVRRPGDGDWAAALLEAIERPGAPPVAVASVSSVHWSDGGALALEGVSRALRARGAALVVDATHAVGVVRTDVAALDPDFLVFPTYKWTLGPYGRAFLYVAKRRQAEGRAAGADEPRAARGRRRPRALPPRPVLRARRAPLRHGRARPLRLAGDGRRGHGDDGGVGRRRGRGAAAGADGPDGGGTARAAGGRAGRGRADCGRRTSCAWSSGRDARRLGRAAGGGDVHVAARIGRVRVSPHVYNDEADVDRFVAAFRGVAR
jgi:selenocysteine lyase/cysteine desulfurase